MTYHQLVTGVVSIPFLAHRFRAITVHEHLHLQSHYVLTLVTIILIIGIHGPHGYNSASISCGRYIYIYPHSGYLSPPFHQFHVVSIYIYTVYIYITIQFLRNHEGIMVLAFYDTPLFLL